MNPAEFFKARNDAHGVHANIAAFRTQLDTVDLSVSPDTLAPRIYRMRKIVDRFEMALKMADPVTVPASILENASSAVSTASQQITSYDSSRNEGYLDNANNALDSILVHLPTIEKRPATKAADAAADIVAKIRRSAEDEIAGLKLTIQEIGTQLTSNERRAGEVSEEVERRSQSIAAEQSRLSQRFEEEEDLRRKAHKERLDEMEAEALLALDRHEKRVADSAARGEATLANTFETQAVRAAHIIEALEADKLAAQNLVGIVGETGMITGWNRAANAARNEARVWNAIALVSLIYAGWEAIQVLTPAAKGEIPMSWEGLLSRTVLLAVLGLIAGFAGKQASRANRVEETNRRYELQLASIGPFIAELDLPTKQTIKTKLVERMYGHAIEIPSDSDNPPVTAGQMLVDFVKQIPAIIKASKQS